MLIAKLKKGSFLSETEIKSRIAMANLHLTRRRILLPANWT
jgi:hypothetical protein